MAKCLHGPSPLCQRVEELGSIMVLVDCFFKYDTYVAALMNCTAEEVVRLFIVIVIKYWAIPESIVKRL